MAQARHCARGSEPRLGWLISLGALASLALVAAGADAARAASASAVEAGVRHTCALTTGGGVLCWGDNVWGQLGDGNDESVETPRPVVGFGGAGSAAVPALGLPALGLLVVALMLAGTSCRWSRFVRSGVA